MQIKKQDLEYVKIFTNDIVCLLFDDRAFREMKENVSS